MEIRHWFDVILERLMVFHVAQLTILDLWVGVTAVKVLDRGLSVSYIWPESRASPFESKWRLFWDHWGLWRDYVALISHDWFGNTTTNIVGAWERLSSRSSFTVTLLHLSGIWVPFHGRFHSKACLIINNLNLHLFLIKLILHPDACYFSSLWSLPYHLFRNRPILLHRSDVSRRQNSNFCHRLDQKTRGLRWKHLELETICALGRMVGQNILPFLFNIVKKHVFVFNFVGDVSSTRLDWTVFDSRGDIFVKFIHIFSIELCETLYLIKHKFITVLFLIKFVEIPFSWLELIQIGHYLFSVSFWIEFYVIVHMLDLCVYFRLLVVFFNTRLCKLGSWSVEWGSRKLKNYFIFFSSLFAPLSHIWTSRVEWVHFFNLCLRFVRHKLYLRRISGFLS